MITMLRFGRDVAVSTVKAIRIDHTVTWYL